LFVVNGIEQLTRWVRSVPAPLGAAELERVTREVRRFFEGLHAQGAFGNRPLARSFFAHVSLERSAERALCILIGFAGPRRPDLHGYRIVQRATGSEVRPASLDRRNLLEYCPQELEWVERLAGQLSG
jgi:hypothetical protein